jgi:hypothetical protein
MTLAIAKIIKKQSPEQHSAERPSAYGTVWVFCTVYVVFLPWMAEKRTQCIEINLDNSSLFTFEV